MQIRHVKHPFGAVKDENSRVLILGSVPSVKSCEKNFYYMHGKNRFWKIMSELVGEDLFSAPIERKIQVLKENHIALYDSVEECDIFGSSDSKISNIIPVNLPELLSGTKIKRIFCNGQASYRVIAKYYPEYIDTVTLLPSSSPANAAFSFERLLEEWKVILNFL